jgi:hypothetical protein
VCRRIAIFFLILTALALVGLGYLYYDITRPDPRIAAEPAPEQSLTETAQPLPDDGPKLKEQVQEIHEASKRGEHLPFEIQVTDRQLNDLVTSTPQVRQMLENHQVRSFRLRFVPGRLVMSARVPVAGNVAARLSAEGEIRAENGDLAYRTLGVYLGSIPAPREMAEELDRQTGAAVEQLNHRFEGQVEAVTITGGLLVVRGRS